jgi:hypothetical protein
MRSKRRALTMEAIGIIGAALGAAREGNWTLLVGGGAVLWVERDP